MPLSPRTLRPANNFTPRSITGLALWLDASDSSTLFQDAAATTPATATNDPVGAWLDKSGNGRHATQSTGANRPKANAAGMNGSRSVQFSGGNSELLSLGNLSSVFPSAAEVIVAYEPLSDTSYGLYETSSSSSYFRNGNGLSYFGAFAQSRQNGISVSMPTSGRHVASIRCNSGGQQVVRLDGAQVFSGTPQGSGYLAGTSHVLGNNNNPASDTGLTGYITDVVAFPRILSDSERSRIERWMAARRGITLAPIVSNADAQDWINRVYANGGTVSASTAAAVNTFCDAIDSAGIRDRFYRLSLMCGGTSGTTAGLNAALVPLYRGPSLGGTRYGNTTDTNVGPFVSGDYAETGAGGGLTGNGSSKYLNTGFPTNTLADGNRHLAAYAATWPNAAYNAMLGSESTAGISSQFTLGHGSVADKNSFGCFSNTSRIQSSVISGGAFWIGINDAAGSGKLYRNGSQDGSAVVSASTPTASNVFVFAINRASSSSATDLFNGRLSGYSIGLSMTASQAAYYHTAMQAFQTALTRNV